MDINTINIVGQTTCLFFDSDEGIKPCSRAYEPNEDRPFKFLLWLKGPGGVPIMVIGDLGIFHHRDLKKLVIETYPNDTFWKEVPDGAGEYLVADRDIGWESNEFKVVTPDSLKQPIADLLEVVVQ